MFENLRKKLISLLEVKDGKEEVVKIKIVDEVDVVVHEPPIPKSDNCCENLADVSNIVNENLAIKTGICDKYEPVKTNKAIPNETKKPEVNRKRRAYGTGSIKYSKRYKVYQAYTPVNKDKAKYLGQSKTYEGCEKLLNEYLAKEGIRPRVAHVHFNKKTSKYNPSIVLKGKQIALGSFNTKKEAEDEYHKIEKQFNETGKIYRSNMKPRRYLPFEVDYDPLNPPKKQTELNANNWNTLNNPEKRREFISSY